MSVHGDDFKSTVLSPDDIFIGDGNRIESRRAKARVDSKDYNTVKDDRDLFEVNSAPLPTSGEGDYLIMASETFQKALESNIKVSKVKDFSIQSIPKEVGQLPYDILVLILRDKNERATLYPFIIADSMEKEYTCPVFFNQASREYVVTPDTIYDSRVYDKIRRIVTLSHPNYEFQQIGFLLIPRGFDYKNNVSVKRILNNAINAMLMSRRNDPIKADHIKRVNPIAKLRFAKDMIPTLHGRLARSDFSITLEATKFKRRKSSHRDVATSDDYVDINNEIIRCDGFIDLIYSQSGGGLFSTRNNENSKYTPRAVLTNIGQKQNADAMGLTLYSIASTYMLQMSKNWALALKRPRGKAVVNEWHDIGAVAYELNVSENPEEHDFNKKVSTNDPNFDNKELKELVNRSFNNGFRVSLDIEMGGPKIWLQTHFSRAAYTADDHKNWSQIAEAARCYIVEVANEITNGKFDEVCGNHRVDVVFPGYEKVHLGTYEDENGELRDIRDVCYRAILNSCNGSDLNPVKTWANSFDPSKSTEGARIAVREDMIRRMTSGKVNFEAMARRVTFNPMFIYYLCQALMANGINMIPIVSEGFNTEEDRYYANYAKFGLDVEPMKLMVLKNNGIDLNNLSSLTPKQMMVLKMLDINPFERQMESYMSRFGIKSGNYDYNRGYSCF